jgi:hypothetical protein
MARRARPGKRGPTSFSVNTTIHYRRYPTMSPVFAPRTERRASRRALHGPQQPPMFSSTRLIAVRRGNYAGPLNYESAQDPPHYLSWHGAIHLLVHLATKARDCANRDDVARAAPGV